MHRTTLLPAAALAACVAASAATFVTNPANGHRYAVTDRADTWHGAQAQAVSYMGNLATVNDAAENAWLVATFGSDLYWIGYNDEAVEGTWVWVSGETASYTNWLPGEPNDLTMEDWALLNWDGAGGWNDWEAGADYTDAAGNFHAQNDSRPIYGIIEVPEPGQYLAVAGLLSLVAVRFLRRQK